MGRDMAFVKIAQPGLHIAYNHDVCVSEEFAQTHATIAEALRDERLLKAFEFYEHQAKHHKRLFHALGFGSLLMGLVTLISAALAAAYGQSMVHVFGRAGVIAEAGSVAALVCVLSNRLGRHRVLWCQAVFCRERLRQWHFQLFMDGQLIGLLQTAPPEFKAEVNRRWNNLQQNLLDGYGIMVAFVRHGSHNDDLMHEPSPYADPELGKTVLRALWTLRFEHQLRFGDKKIETEAEQAGMALAERTAASESVATVTLAGAVFVGALGFFAGLAEAYPGLAPLAWDVPVLSRYLVGTSLLLAVLSAASRAYRAGYTLPDESESYKEYSDRIREFRAVFESATTDEERFRQLARLEAEAAAELRRFLKMKMRATFIF